MFNIFFIDAEFFIKIIEINWFRIWLYKRNIYDIFI